MTHGFEVMPPSLDELLSDHIYRTMVKYKGNKTRAARALGVSVDKLRGKLLKYNIGLGPAEVRYEREVFRPEKVT